MTTDRRAKKVDEALRLVWSSLESHLDLTSKKSYEGKTFHKRCVKGYARIVSLLSDLY